MRLAARGARNMDSGVEQIDDDAVTAQIRRQARAVIRKALIAALVLTAAVLVLPV